MTEPHFKPSDQQAVSPFRLWIRFVDALDQRPRKGVDGRAGQPGPTDHQGEGLEPVDPVAPHQCTLGTLDGGAVGVDLAALQNVGLEGGGSVRVSPLLQRVEQTGTRVADVLSGWGEAVHGHTVVLWERVLAAIEAQAAGCHPNPMT